MQIRRERAHDIGRIRHVNEAAFGASVEANLVDALRDSDEQLSLVADDDGVIVGHILFSPVTLSSHPGLRIMALGPMAVVPERQRQGIGSALVRRGVDECRRLGATAIVVVGHPTYYPRFGFAPGSRVGLACEYDVPDDVFMVLELEEGVLNGKAGTIRYLPAFASV